MLFTVVNADIFGQIKAVQLQLFGRNYNKLQYTTVDSSSFWTGIQFRTLHKFKRQRVNMNAMKWSKLWNTRHHTSEVFAAILVQVYITVFGRAKVARE